MEGVVDLRYTLAEVKKMGWLPPGSARQIRDDLAQVLGWGDFRQCSAGQQAQFVIIAREMGLDHLGNPHIRPELFAENKT